MRKKNEEVLVERARSVVEYLSEHDGWISCEDVANALGLTIGQIKAAVKYERRWYLETPEKCGNKYILSGPKGYKLPNNDDDYVAMYKSLYAWGKSVLITISPIGKYMQGKGYDVSEIRKEAMVGHGLIKDSIGGSDSWQDEN